MVPRNANLFHLGGPTLSEVGFAVALEVTGGLPMDDKRPEKPRMLLWHKLQIRS
jgi:hypothetical protein